jgi:phosphatidylserine/phosphatidylglycerophosphate/cardiolipin synthase-like enzyme
VRRYEGVDTYKFIDPLLNDGGRTLSLITPFISTYYSRKLLAVAGRKRVRLITSGSDINKKALGMIHAGRRGVYLRVLLYLFALSALLFYFNLILFAVGVSAAFAAVLALMILTLTGRKAVEVRVVRHLFIHEKAYISETMAITGSANLTYSGTHKNLEHIDVIDDAQEIKRLSEHFEKLWSMEGA